MARTIVPARNPKALSKAATTAPAIIIHNLIDSLSDEAARAETRHIDALVKFRALVEREMDLPTPGGPVAMAQMLAHVTNLAGRRAQAKDAAVSAIAYIAAIGRNDLY